MFGELVDAVAWLLRAAEDLYYLAGFFIVVGGFVLFVGSAIGMAVSRAGEKRSAQATSAPAPVNVHIENLNVNVLVVDPQRISDATALEPDSSRQTHIE